MKIGRFSVGRWIVVVVVVALNLAVGQRLAAFDERLLTGVLLIAIVHPEPIPVRGRQGGRLSHPADFGGAAGRARGMVGQAGR